jgi:hypothetical protein
VNLAIISNFAASGSWTAPAHDFRDGAGGGGEHGAAARPGRERIARAPCRSGAKGTAATLILLAWLD